MTVIEMIDREAANVEKYAADDASIEATLHAVLGNCYDGLGRFQDAEHHLKKALDLRVAEDPEEKDSYTLRSMREYAGVVMRLGRYDEAIPMHVNTVDRIRRRFALEGEVPTLNRKARTTPPIPRKFDGRAEAQIVAICCSQAPEGRTRWTLRLIVDELKKRRIVTSVSPETIRKTLKKTNCSLGEKNAGASRKEIARGSSRKWKKSSISTKRNPAQKSR